MYSNDLTQIKIGLTNFIGALINATPYENKNATKHSVVASLLEESSNLCKNEDNEYDMFICKPVFRLTKNIFIERMNKLKELPQVAEVKEQIKIYELMIIELDKIIKQTQFKGSEDLG